MKCTGHERAYPPCACALCPTQQFSRGNTTVQTNSLKDLLQNKIDDMEKQVLSRVNTLEEPKGAPRNDSEQRNRVESTLTSLHHRITDLEKGACAPPLSLRCEGDLRGSGAASLRIFKQHFGLFFSPPPHNGDHAQLTHANFAGRVRHCAIWWLKAENDLQTFTITPKHRVRE